MGDLQNHMINILTQFIAFKSFTFYNEIILPAEHCMAVNLLIYDSETLPWIKTM